MEGFANYFAQAVARYANTQGKTLTGPTGAGPHGNTGDTSLSTSSRLPPAPAARSCTRASGSKTSSPARSGISSTTRGAFEPADRLCNQDRNVFAIFDYELQRRPANIWAFTEAWIDRGLDLPPLLSVYKSPGHRPAAAADTGELLLGVSGR